MSICSHRAFLNFLISRGLYAFASSAIPALLSIAVAGSGSGAIGIGLVLGTGAVPAVVGGLFSPAFLRTISQRQLFSITSAAWIVVAVISSIWSYSGRITLIGYVLISFLLELAGSTLFPALNAYLPVLVNKGELEQANSIQTVVLGTCSVAGPAMASLFTTITSESIIWLCLALLMALSLISQRTLPEGNYQSSHETEYEGALGEIRSGWRYFIGLKPVVIVVFGSALWHFFIWSLFMTEGPISLQHDYRSAWGWGLIQSIFSLGSILGALIPLPHQWSTVRICLLSLVPFCFVPVMMLAHMPLWLLFILVMTASMGMAAAGVRWSAAIQQSVPTHRLASVFSFDYIMSEGMAPLGFIMTPLVVSLFGQRNSILFLTITISVVLTVLAVFANYPFNSEETTIIRKKTIIEK